MKIKKFPRPVSYVERAQEPKEGLFQPKMGQFRVDGTVYEIMG